ncbi:MAG: hypothetical protein EU539_11835 [Promethearchaeota archaeon]|nr:MAG: hypothetical protein EU539_11835 [Candidatus Lokiarchaeota archaeon]
MLFEENFRYFDFFDAIEMGLYFVIVGYYFLLFAFFLLMRYRTSMRLYWLFFSFLFLFLAAGRVFFIGYYFFLPELQGRMSNASLGSLLMLFYRLATFFSWLAIACLMGVLGTLLFPPDTEFDKIDTAKDAEEFQLTPNMKIILRILLIACPIIVGILALTLPDSYFMDPAIVRRYNLNVKLVTVFGYPIGRFVLNFILVPLFIAVIPILFLYLAIRTFGVLRRSYALNAIGFFLYYAGRILQGVYETIGWHHFESTVPPLIILLSLLIIVIANNYEQLR